MAQHNVGAVVVTQDGALEGVLSERDIVCRAVAEGLPLDEKAARAASAKLTPYVKAMLQDLNDQPIEAICAGKVRFPDNPGEQDR